MNISKATDNDVAVIAIVKNEEPYLIEWIAYYRLLGVTQIIMFDNESRDKTYEILKKLEENRIVRVEKIFDKDCEEHSPQYFAYKRGTDMATTEWILFCDLDEFLFIDNKMKIREFVSRFDENISIIGLNWRAFGSSNIEAYEDRPVLERFKLGSVSQNESNRWFKSIARRTRIRRPGIHVPIAPGKRVHADGSPLANRIGDDNRKSRSTTVSIVHDPAAMAHFGTKSKEEFDAKIARGRAGVNVLSTKKQTPARDARRKWESYNINETEIAYFDDILPELLAEIDKLNQLLI